MYHDEMTGFLSDLRDGAAATAPHISTNNQPTLLAVSTSPTIPTSLMNNSRSFNGFQASTFPTFSTATSSDRLSSGNLNQSLLPPTSSPSTNPSAPSSRSLPGLRNSGEHSLGSYNNNLQTMPTTLSSDPTLPPQPLPQRSPSSPIPHLQQTTFVTNSPYPFNVNQSPNVSRQTFNYSPQPHHISQNQPLRPAFQQQTQLVNLNPNQSSHTRNLSRSLPSHPMQNPHIPQQSQSQTPQAILQSTAFQQQFAIPHQVQQQSQNNSNSPDPTTQSNQLVQSSIALPPQPSSSPHPFQNSNLDSNLILQQTQITDTLPPSRSKSSTQHANNSTQVSGLSTSNTPPKQRKQSRAQASKRARSNIDRSQQNTNEPRTNRQNTISQPTNTPKKSNNNTSITPTPTVNTNPGNTNTTPTTGNTEEQSRPERKREREKRRRETMNNRFSELAACLTISAGGKSDKESILAEAVEHVKKQAANIKDLEKQNKELLSTVQDLKAEKIEIRQDKNYIREERDRLKAELELLRSEQQQQQQTTTKGRKRQKLENGKKETKSAKDKRGIKPEPAAA